MEVPNGIGGLGVDTNSLIGKCVFIYDQTDLGWEIEES